MTAPIYTPLAAAIPVRMDPTPYRDDPLEAAEFYRALGTYMVAWGRFEGHLLGCLLMIRSLPGAPAQPDRFPVSFKRRAACWRSAWSTVPGLQPYAGEALPLMSDIMAEAQNRSGIVHSMWREFVPGPGPTLRRLQIKPSPGAVTVHTGDLPAEALVRATERANMLNNHPANGPKPPPLTPKQPFPYPFRSGVSHGELSCSNKLSKRIKRFDAKTGHAWIGSAGQGAHAASPKPL